MADSRDLPEPDPVLRTDLRPGDLGWIVRRHGVVYAEEYGFSRAFEAYVAGPLAEFALHATDRERLWIAEERGHPVGCVAIVAASPDVAQLRWYFVEPAARGRGLGRRLLHEAVAFSRACGYRSVILWTVDLLTAASHLYEAAGFRRVETRPGCPWGVDLIEEKYELRLAGD